MVKVYYSYSPAVPYSQITSQTCPIATDGASLYGGVNQYVVVVGEKEGVKGVLVPSKGGGDNEAEATSSQIHRVRVIKVYQGCVYAGYEGGQIVKWDLTEAPVFSISDKSASNRLNNQRPILPTSTYDLHTAAVTCLIFVEGLMVSAGMDTHIVAWDLLSEEAVQMQCGAIQEGMKLISVLKIISQHAHHNAITSIHACKVFLNGKPTIIVLSVGKDGFFKVHNLENKCCLATLSTQATEAHTLYFDPLENLVYIGTNKEDIVIVALATEFQSTADFCRVVHIFKRKNYARAVQMIGSGSTIRLLNADKTVQTYQIVRDALLTKKVKKAIAKVDQLTQPVNSYRFKLKHGTSRTFPFKVSSLVEMKGRWYCSNGWDLFQVNLNPGEQSQAVVEEAPPKTLPQQKAPIDRQITRSGQKTMGLELEHPFLVQRTATVCNVYSVGSWSKLYSIGTKVSNCSLFGGGFLLVLQSDSVGVWSLAKGQEIFKLNQQWLGSLVKGSNCMLWKGDVLALYSLGKDKKGVVKMLKKSDHQLEDNIRAGLIPHQRQDKYIVALDNNQIHINYADTHKNHLKLYGHKLPVNAVDVSSDGALLVSCSVDKDIRLWDMDFGNCLKSIFAHSEPVTTVRFLWDTHYILSGSKDGHVRFWDGDTYDLVQDFDDCLGEVRGLVVTPGADYIVAGGLDGGFRVWAQTQEQVVANDLREKQAEKAMIEDYTAEKFKDRPTKTRFQDLKHGQQIIEALDAHVQPPELIKLLRAISPSNLKSSLSFLHTEHYLKLERYLQLLIDNGYEEELCWRVLCAIERPSQQAKAVRQGLQKTLSGISMNVQFLRILGKAVKQEEEFDAA